MSDSPVVSVILACYNESGLLEGSFVELVDTLRESGDSFELVFVDDCSRDRTPEIIAALVKTHPDVSCQVLLHEKNKGRGQTVTDGFRLARGTFVGYLDVDLEVHSRYIPSLVRALRQGADVATVRRIYALQIRSLDRYFMSRGYSFLVRKMLGLQTRDTETGYKFFRRSSLMPLFDAVADTGWFWDTEIMALAEQKGLKIVEIPGAYVRRYDKISAVSGIRDSIDYFAKLWRFRRRLRSAR